MFEIPVDLYSDSPNHHYQLQTHAFVDQFLAEHQLTREMLHDLPEEKSWLICKQALNFAAEQIARLEAMIRLGQNGEDVLMQSHLHNRQNDRLDHHFRHLNHHSH
jgi:hypothetical protein